MINKKGQGLSTTTIILLILGILVLVFLIIGFTTGFGKLAPFLSKNNAGSISTACEISCNTGEKFGFCSESRDLSADGVKIDDVTCNYLAEKESKYGIELCPEISCDEDPADSKEEVCGDSDNAGKTFQVVIDNALKIIKYDEDC